MSQESPAQLYAEATELRIEAIQLRNKATLLMEQSELMETQAEQAATFSQTSEQHHDKLVKLARVNKNTRELIEATASGIASKKEIDECAGLLYRVKTRGSSEDIRKVAQAVLLKLDLEDHPELCEEDSSSIDGRSNAGSTDLGNNGEVESELSDEIERARNEGMQRAASERDSSSGPDAVFSPDLENAIESWQDRFRHKRKRSDLLTLEGLREENSRMTKRPRHPEHAIAAFCSLLRSLQDQTPASRAEMKSRLCCGRCGIYDGAAYDPLLTTCLHTYCRQCFDFLQVSAEEEREEYARCKQCDEPMGTPIDLDDDRMSDFRQYATEDLSQAYQGIEYESGDGVSDTQSYKGEDDESCDDMDDFIVSDSEEHDVVPKRLSVARLLFQRRQIGGLQLAAFGLPTRRSPQPDDFWVDASDLKPLSG